MKVDANLHPEPSKVAMSAAGAEVAGYAGAWAVETSHDPFVASVSAITSTECIDVGPAIAVAFARSPMTVAATANDLQVLGKGRFILGLGSQVKAHIERRFSMPWSSPAPRMREYVCALRAIWSSWSSGEALDFRGDFYTHTLMSPFFAPPPNPYGPPRVVLAGVGSHMTEVAGEVCDGFICHPFTTERYLREVTLPALARGHLRADGDRPSFEVVGPGMVAVGRDDDELAAATTATKLRSPSTHRPPPTSLCSTCTGGATSKAS